MAFSYPLHGEPNQATAGANLRAALCAFAARPNVHQPVLDVCQRVA
ncbi:MAG TPA: hypothetical protein VMU32_01415 [Solirubrobacteraceae bacterium]|nr:hypothetical protein [Solirubrobacteraceae bacterium]